MRDASNQSRSRGPLVGVGCIVIRDDRILMVKRHDGRWSTPGGHLDFGESPGACAARETLEETGIRVRNVEFVAITIDLLADVDRHYVTLWMRAEPDGAETLMTDVREIAEVGWFPVDAMPTPRYAFYENLLAGRTMPVAPGNLPAVLRGRSRPPWVSDLTLGCPG